MKKRGVVCENWFENGPFADGDSVGGFARLFDFVLVLNFVKVKDLIWVLGEGF